MRRLFRWCRSPSTLLRLRPSPPRCRRKARKSHFPSERRVESRAGNPHPLSGRALHVSCRGIRLACTLISFFACAVECVSTESLRPRSFTDTQRPETTPSEDRADNVQAYQNGRSAVSDVTACTKHTPSHSGILILSYRFIAASFAYDPETARNSTFKGSGRYFAKL